MFMQVVDLSLRPWKTMLELNVVETDLGLMGTPISKVNTGTDMYRLMFRGIPMYGRRSVLLIFQI